MFLVVWSGGYEPPAFFASDDKDEALEKFGEWARAMGDGENGDCIHALHITQGLGALDVEILEVYTGEEEGEFV